MRSANRLALLKEHDFLWQNRLKNMTFVMEPADKTSNPTTVWLGIDMQILFYHL